MIKKYLENWKHWRIRHFPKRTWNIEEIFYSAIREHLKQRRRARNNLWRSIHIRMVKYPPWFSIVITLRHTYSSIVNFICLNIKVTWVIFSIINPTSCRSCSIVISRPIIDVKQLCNVHKFDSTWNKKQGLPWRKVSSKLDKHLPGSVSIFSVTFGGEVRN